MSEPENFLSRWSRRKLENEQEQAAQSGEQDASVHPRESGASNLPQQPVELAALDSRSRGNERAESTDQSNEPPLDLSKLPSLESITAETDIRAFLQKGVPAELSRAALRRAWLADPAIRDFVEIAENQWDFATGKDLPGFGDLNIGTEELRRMVASVFGEAPPPAEPQAGTPAQPERTANAEGYAAGDSAEETGAQDFVTSSRDQLPTDPVSGEPILDVVRRNEVNTAMQQSNAKADPVSPPMRKPHGRALPQ